MKQAVRVLTRTDVERLLDIRSCITAVEDALRRRAEGSVTPGGMLGVHAAQGGFHVKAATLDVSRPYFVAKVNANFPANPTTLGLPTIQGVLVLFDASCGVPLAVMDSMSITTLRTAAASAVAVRHLSRADARTATFVGCGVQARAHMAALATVRALEHAFVFDVDQIKAARFADEMRARYAFGITVADDLTYAVRASDIVVTCTSSTKAFLDVAHVSPGSFVAAVGADNERKQEIAPSLLRASAVVVDDLDQCAAIGDLHHAIEANALSRGDVRGTIGDVIAGKTRGRMDEDEIIVFDSTGVAIEDVAAAAVTYERAVLQGAGLEVALGS